MRKLTIHRVSWIPSLILATAFTGCATGEGEKRSELKAAQEEMLAGKRVAVLITEGFHDDETLVPSRHLADRGATITVIGPRVGEFKAYNSDQRVMVEKAVGDVTVDQFDALIIPGGRAPAALRQDEAVVAFAREFVRSGKPVAAICHGPQVLVTAGVMEGRTATAVSGVRPEIEEAGGRFVDEPVVRDRNLITSRLPKDLPVFCDTITRALRG